MQQNQNTALRQELRRLRYELSIVQEENKRLEKSLEAVAKSPSWRITAPLRKLKAWYRIARFLAQPSLYCKIVKVIQRRVNEVGWQGFVQKVIAIQRDHGLLNAIRFIPSQAAGEISYEQWVEDYDTLGDADRTAIRAHIETFPHKPVISVVMPVYNIGETWLREAIESVRNQLYPYWEFCIADDCSPAPHIRAVLEEYQQKDSRIKVVFREKNGHISAASNSALEIATGEFVALLDHDDTLPEHALYYVANEINQHADVDLMYSDEDKINATGRRYGPYFKSDWNPDLFYAQNMFSHLGVYRRSILTAIGGFRLGYEGSQDYDLCLRALGQTTPDKVRHIPRVLYHWRAIEGSTALNIDSKSYALDAARRAMRDYFDAHYPDALVVDAPGANKRFGYNHILWPTVYPEPKASIIIPTRDHCALLKQCIDSIREKTTYGNYDITIVNNQSTDPETLKYFETLKKQSIAQVINYDKPFNYSAINNYAVSQTDGDILVFMNNDIEVVTPDWLDEMVSHALRPDVGAVGAKLLYDDNTVQHAGVVVGVGPHRVASHAFHCIPRDAEGYYSRALLTHCVTAVTAACAVMRREVFKEVGGFDEVNLSIAYNDVDLCLKLREKGYWNIFTPHAVLYHYESRSRGQDKTPEKEARLQQEANYMLTHWGETLANDPFYNPNLGVALLRYVIMGEPRLQQPWKDTTAWTQKQAA